MGIPWEKDIGWESFLPVVGPTVVVVVGGTGVDFPGGHAPIGMKLQ